MVVVCSPAMRDASRSTTPDERLYSIEQSHLIKSRPQQVEILSRRPRKSFRFLWLSHIAKLWAALAMYAALVTVALVCTNARMKGVGADGLKRRLAAEDNLEDPFPLLPSPEIEELCSSLGPWTPAETSAGDPRRSPYMVEDFFKEMERDEESEAAQFVLGEAVTGPAAPGPRTAAGGDEEEAGSNSRYLVPEPSASAATTPPSEPSNSSTTLPAEPSHPFVHVPKLLLGAKPRQWSASLEQRNAPCLVSLHPTLFYARQLLLESSLDTDAADELILHTEALAAYAQRRLYASTTLRSPRDAVRDLGLRFMVLNTLHSATQAISQPPPLWWQPLVDGMLKNYKLDSPPPWRFPASFNPTLARDLSRALLLYKNGDAPTPAEVLDIKRRLLCNLKAPSFFHQPEWNAWKADDLEFYEDSFENS